MGRKVDIEPAVLNVKQAAEYLNCDVEKVRALDRAGVLRGMNLGGLKFHVEELDKFLRYGVGLNFDDPENVRDRYSGARAPKRAI